MCKFLRKVPLSFVRQDLLIHIVRRIFSRANCLCSLWHCWICFWTAFLPVSPPLPDCGSASTSDQEPSCQVRPQQVKTYGQEYPADALSLGGIALHRNGQVLPARVRTFRHISTTLKHIGKPTVSLRMRSPFVIGASAKIPESPFADSGLFVIPSAEFYNWSTQINITSSLFPPGSKSTLFQQTRNNPINLRHHAE